MRLISDLVEILMNTKAFHGHCVELHYNHLPAKVVAVIGFIDHLPLSVAQQKVTNDISVFRA